MSGVDTPAFPRDHRYEGHNGITMRDYFAAKAMQGFAAEGTWSDSEHVVKLAYRWADLMLKARGEK